MITGSRTEGRSGAIRVGCKKSPKAIRCRTSISLVASKGREPVTIW